MPINLYVNKEVVNVGEPVFVYATASPVQDIDVYMFSDGRPAGSFPIYLKSRGLVVEFIMPSLYTSNILTLKAVGRETKEESNTVIVRVRQPEPAQRVQLSLYASKTAGIRLGESVQFTVRAEPRLSYLVELKGYRGADQVYKEVVAVVDGLGTAVVDVSRAGVGSTTWVAEDSFGNRSNPVTTEVVPEKPTYAVLAGEAERVAEEAEEVRRRAEELVAGRTALGWLKENAWLLILVAVVVLLALWVGK
jgi:hypothetical protein